MIVVTGLMAEARLAAAPGISVLAGGGHAANLVARIEEAIKQGGTSILSFGIAGGLSPALKPGQWCIARNVISKYGSHAADPEWAEQLLNLVEGADLHDMFGADQPIATPLHKRTLHSSTGASTVDMESHIAAHVAAANQLPFAAARVVADPAGRGVPPAALVGLHPDGSVNLPAVLESLLRYPRQLPALMKIAQDTRTALQALFEGRHRLGPRFGLRDPRVRGWHSSRRASSTTRAHQYYLSDRAEAPAATVF